MSQAFVLGNGISRKNINLSELQPYGKIYGCNALHREFVPNVLVATDRPISAAIQESGYAKNHEFYTRRPMEGLGAKSVLKKYHGYSSGPNALALAAEHGHRQVYLLGFDMGPNVNNTFNNVYADTEFYKTSAHPPTFAGNWKRQIVEICKDYPHTEFVRVCGPTTARIAELESVKNLTHLDLDAFTDRINNKKDL
jgi:hypothetical protein